MKDQNSRIHCITNSTTNNKLPVVSVITTFYNAERFVLNAINSINVQLGQGEVFNLEYIIVDDKSPDRSRELVETYMSRETIKGDWKLLTPEQNLGCGGARRYGIEHATGDLFMFLDADDYYINIDFIRRAVQEITSQDADIVEYGVLYNQPNGQQQHNCSPKDFVITNQRAAEIALFKDNLIKFNVWSKIYKRWVVESYRYSDERTFEDVRTIPVWIWNAKKIIIKSSVEINYRAASDSIIRTDWNKTRLGTISAIASHFERFKSDKQILKAMYGRAMVDLEVMLNQRSSENEGFNEMSKLNTYMLKYIYPDKWQELTYEV